MNSLKKIMIIIIFLALLGVVASEFSGAMLVRADGPFYIRADGVVQPYTSLIDRSGNTYTLLGDISGGIVVQRSNITIDGQRMYGLFGSSPGSGFTLEGVSNITITGTWIENFTNGILMDYSHQNLIMDNDIVGNDVGILFFGSQSGNNSVVGNHITGNDLGIEIYMHSGANLFCMNNFDDNGINVKIWGATPNTWNNDWWGNYWSNYTGSTSVPLYGEGDAPHVINAENIDHHPLMYPIGKTCIPFFSEEFGYSWVCVTTVSNSSEVGSFEMYRDPLTEETLAVGFYVTGSDGTTGFCRVAVPHIILEPPYDVIVDDNPVYYTTLSENETESVLYFIYTHSTKLVTIVHQSNATKLDATLTLQSSLTSATIFEDFTLNGSLSTPRSGTVTLRWSINGSDFIYTRDVTMAGGQYSSVFGASTPGTWAFKATWGGDSDYNPTESNTVTVSVTQPAPQTGNVTFALAGTMDFTGNVLTVDSVSYTASQLPKTFTWDVNSTHTFAWLSPVSSSSTTYTWASTSGLAAAQSGTITAITGGGTVTATYSGAPVKSGCFIATATYGSEAAPQVQALRDFRDGIAMKTFAGSNFMTGFLTWYYSWSPPVADTIAPDSNARAVMRVILQPLLNILDVATSVNSALSFNSEFAIVSAGFAAASLIGLVYFLPLTTLALVGAKKYGRNLHLPGAAKVLSFTAVPWVISIALIAVAEFTMAPLLMMAATGAFVVLTIVMTVSTVSLWLVSFYKRG